MSGTGGKFLVVRGGAIGDFILTLPVLAALRRHFPQCPLEVLGYPHIAQLAVAGGLAGMVRSIEARALAGFFADRGELDKALERYFAEFAVIISYLYDPDGVFQANVARCSKAQFIAGAHRPLETARHHAATVLLQPLERLAIFDADPVPRLVLRGANQSAPAPGQWLAVHPGSGSEKKNWPEPNWREFLQVVVASTGIGILLVGGEAEGGRLERLAAGLPPGRVHIARNLPLPDLARQLTGCVAFAGHDSGISHLAAALGLPALVLWGDTNEAVWRPLGEHVRLLRSPGGLTALKPDAVLAALRDLRATDECT